MVFEPREGGHVYDRGVDGSECRWARVLAYEPPNRGRSSSNINTQWQLETDSERTSEVGVRFVAEAAVRRRRWSDLSYVPRARCPQAGSGRRRT